MGANKDDVDMIGQVRRGVLGITHMRKVETKGGLAGGQRYRHVKKGLKIHES